MYTGEIRMFAHGAVPANWHECDGALLATADYPDLFAAVGTTYGGDGTTTFGLPDFRGRCAIGVGQGEDLTARLLGDAEGEEAVAIVLDQMPAHSHLVNANNGSASSTRPAGNFPGKNGGNQQYETTAGVTMNVTMIASAGNGSPHDNMQPFLAVVFAIALTEGV